MRRSSSARPAATYSPVRGDWKTVKSLFPYLWEFRGRVVLALACLFIAKLANVGVPLVLKEIVDSLDPTKALLALPVFLLLGYGLLRLTSTLFAEFRDLVFAKVAQRSIRNVALKTFRHLHSLSLRFHLERQTGGVSRDVERGTRGIDSLLRFAIFSIIPTLFEMALVSVILIRKYNIWFAVITVGALVTYVTLTVVITEWRTQFRRTMNELDSKANTRAVDSLLNYE
ncbi:MAG: metal ABC transporter permease, partial [Burkholderiales bacterium]|nr:metal ABC transporter permease [Burkholderiales bacterium]